MKLKIFICLAILFSIAACKEEEIQKWIRKIETKKTAAQTVETPYTHDGKTTLKAYFSELNEMVRTLKNKKKYVKPLNDTIEKNNLETLCPKILILKDEWDQIIKNCTRNRFFLCAEEVRSYPDIVLAFKNFLNSKNLKKFNTIHACCGSLE